MRRFSSVLLLVVLFGCLHAQGPRTPAEREQRWREDLKVFSAILHGTWTDDGKKPLAPQKDLEKLYPALDRDLETLTGDVAKLRDGEIHLRLARILASAHVAHNMVHLPTPLILPITVRWLDNGPMIVGASTEHRGVIGARITKIGGLTSDAVLDAIAPYISYETEAWKRTIAENYVRGRTLLELLHLTSDGHVDLTLEGPSGTSVVSMAFASSSTKIVGMSEALGFTPPLAESRPERPGYWSQYLEDEKVLFIQYNSCFNDPARPFAKFVKQAMEEADQKGVRRVVVDMRFNTGGDSRVIKPLIAELAARRKALGMPYVLIGQQTFSSGVMGAEDLRKKSKAKLMGSPTGGYNRGYGESPPARLPNSRLSFQYTIKNFGSGHQVVPDIKIAPTVADLRAGRDVVLEAALKAP
jgi:hypothetical protein